MFWLYSGTEQILREWQKDFQELYRVLAKEALVSYGHSCLFSVLPFTIL